MLDRPLLESRRILALISEAELYIKADEGSKQDFLDKGMEKFRPFPDKPMRMPYYKVPADVLETRGDLEEWSRKAIMISK